MVAQIVESRVADSRLEQRRHVHEWRLQAVEYDDFGAVRLFECPGCGGVFYS